MVLALTGIGCEKEAVCQPEAVSPVKETDASSVPVTDQMRPVCVPVSLGAFQRHGSG